MFLRQQSCFLSPDCLHGMQSLPHGAPFQGLLLGRRCFNLVPTPSTILVLYPTSLFVLLSISLNLFARSPFLVCSTNKTVLVWRLSCLLEPFSPCPSFSHLSKILSSFSSLLNLDCPGCHPSCFHPCGTIHFCLSVFS